MATDSTDGAGGGLSNALTPWMLWAKWSRDTKTAGSYHPVLCHLIDVGMATEALWRRVLPRRWKERCARELGMEVAEAERWVVFWAGLHDLGKVCPGFQLQLNGKNAIAHSLVVQRLREAGLSWKDAPWVAHGAVSAKALRVILPAQYCFSQGLANSVAIAVGGHHGRFQQYGELRDLKSYCVGDELWDEARVRYAAWLAEAIGLTAAPTVATMEHAVAMMLAGLISVADWIGSDERFFAHGAQDARRVPALDIASYRDKARSKAREALDTLGWTGWVPSNERQSFAQLFAWEPRPLQKAAVDIADALDGPAIVVVESPMGEGKTEAAMYLADHWGATLGQRGIYFALPTMATSNSMFDRVREFLAHRYPTDVVNLQLMHGHAALSETLDELHKRWRGLLAPNNIYAGDDKPETAKGEVVAAEWFSAGKKAILAPFGVGTVDQALLAALQIKHVFVRLYGLSTKTIVVDEVHAYDAYMSVLLERLLTWLGAFGVPVVLLSATLPSQRRQLLIEAYAQGAGWEASAPKTEASYPRITWASAAGCDARETAVSGLNHRTAVVEWVSGAIPKSGERGRYALGERLVELLDGGGCAAVICNTVGRAQQVYEALKPLFGGNADDGQPMLCLLHARYPHEERAKLERQVLGRFSKEGKRPKRAVVVATQVIEQSLDLDFDVMVTDLAPADLVLQRMGRLWRHERSRPDHLGQPLLLIMQPEDDGEGVPIFERGSEAVYAPHILLRSYLELRGRETLALPDDIEDLVESVYDERVQCPEEASPEVAAFWSETLEKLHRVREEEQQQAMYRYIKQPKMDGPLAEVVSDPREEEAPGLHPALQALTRLAEETVPVVCLYGTPDQPLLRKDGPPINLKHKPNASEVEALLLRSVSLSDKRVVRTLLEQKAPPHWEETALLKNHRALFFDANGVTFVGKWRVRLDPELGIVIGE
jgi:CRISPR-associated endonuclease/helicase Cas3